MITGLTVTVGLVSCDSGEMRRTPGHVYAPDMTYSRAYDAYTSNPKLPFADGLVSRKPVAGTIAQNHELPDRLVEGDTNAYKTFNTAMRFSDMELAEGKRLFNIYCGICHGTGLDGQGPLFTSGKFASMPANLKDAKYLHMPSGQVYAAMKFGKNMMGSYASQLDIKQRWMVVAYIKKVQSENGGDAYTYAATATAEAAPVAAAETAAAPAAEEAAHAAH